MKNNLKIMLILILGVTCCIPSAVVKAVEIEEKPDDSFNMSTNDNLDFLTDYSGMNFQDDLDLGKFWKAEPEQKKLLSGSLDTEEDKKKTQYRNAEKENIGMKQLYIPEKLEMIIDPWELDGKGQIYSEPYVIRNEGETPGILTLSELACIPQKDSGVIVRTDSAGLHCDQEKALYMQMMFGHGEQIVLSEVGTEYQAELQPGEELSVCLTGEVNEYALEEWKESDITVSVIYSWNVKENTEDSRMDEEANKDMKKDEDEDGEDMGIGEGTEEEVNEDISAREETEEDVGVEEEIDGTNTDIPDVEAGKGEEANTEVDMPKVIAFQESTTSKLTVSSWKWEEDGTIYSEPYTIRNAGGSTGTFILTELLFKSSEQSGISDQTELGITDSSERKPVYMELVTESQGKFILLNELSQEDAKESAFEIELRPGEEAVFRFVGKINGMEWKERNDGDIAMEALCIWKLKDNIAEEN